MVWVHLQMVVVGCAMLYALPNMKIGQYRQVIFPVILPWLLPVVQIAMMSSVYCTIVMSFERYIRICHLCQLRDCSYITMANFKWVPYYVKYPWHSSTKNVYRIIECCSFSFRYYIIAIIGVPVLFYAPKFFELRTVDASSIKQVKNFSF